MLVAPTAPIVLGIYLYIPRTSIIYSGVSGWRMAIL
jgi:hypothetical protein